MKSCLKYSDIGWTKRWAALSLSAWLGFSASAQVFINEVLSNPSGSDTGNEFFELRGTPGLPLAGYYLLSLEGGGGAGRGDINQFFDLSAFSLGANGYLFARQAASKYTATAAGATVIENTIDTGWGQVNVDGSGVGHSADGSQRDLENGTTTILLVNIGSGVVPNLTNDLDPNDDGFLDLPAGWTVVDSVGIMDGSDAAATVYSYGAITFRAPATNGNYLGTCAYGNIINVPGPLTTSSGTFHVGRKGESTGSSSNDWVGSIVDGTAGAPLNLILFSSSDPSYTGIKISDMVYGGTNASSAPPGSLAYTPTINGSRFTNFTHLPIGGTIGDMAVDPRDNTTMLFTVDSDVSGGIYRAYKVASGNWWVDSTPVVSGLNRPAGLVVQDDGTLWWVHDFTMSLMRLKAPWPAHTPEVVISNFGAAADDDPIDLTFAPANFTGSPGQPNWIVIADRGSDDNALNALNLLDPATTELNQINSSFLVTPTAGSLGFDDLMAIGSLPQSGEVITLSKSQMSAVNANGTIRYITPTTVAPTAGTALAVDPTTGRVWLADDSLDEVWSVDPSVSGQTADIKELSFPLVDPLATFRQIKFHDPGMAFATNGAFLVVSDTSITGGGGRLWVFHSEPFVPFTLPPFPITNVSLTVQGPQLQWAAVGDASFNLKYSVQRGTNPAALVTIATNLTTTSFTDTNAPAGAAFYRVMTKP